MYSDLIRCIEVPGPCMILLSDDYRFIFPLVED